MRKRKKLTLGRILKFVFGALVFLTLPTLLLFGFLYLKYNEDLPQGVLGPEADLLAERMLDALNHEAYTKTDYLEWTFKSRHHYKWDKASNKCAVYWKSYRVDLNLDDPNLSTAYKKDVEIKIDNKDIIEKALNYFNNDSFWLVAPYKVFDMGVERRLVETEKHGDALLVTYRSGGSTPGDSYLWLMDENKRPKAFKMWTSILPIDGLEASWSDWTTTDSGTELPTFHKLLVLGLEITDISTEPKS